MDCAINEAHILFKMGCDIYMVMDSAINEARTLLKTVGDVFKVVNNYINEAYNLFIPYAYGALKARDQL